jgi:hypothetical protein
MIDGRATLIIPAQDCHSSSIECAKALKERPSGNLIHAAYGPVGGKINRKN